MAIIKDLLYLLEEKLINDFINCYNECKKMLPGSDFEAFMADLSITILEVQAESGNEEPPGILFIAALLSTPDENDSPDDIERLKFVKAAAVWLIKNQSKFAIPKI